MVVQPGQDWDGDNDTGPLDRPTQRCVFAQSKVCPDLIVVRSVRTENLPQCDSPKINTRSKHSRRTVPTDAPHTDFAAATQARSVGRGCR